MKNVILFDDRESRQTLFFEETDINFENYSDVIVNVSGVKACQEKLTQFLNDNGVLDQYGTIMVHKSILPDNNSDIISALKESCQKKSQNLVLFSGGVDTVFYTGTSYR